MGSLFEFGSEQEDVRKNLTLNLLIQTFKQCSVDHLCNCSSWPLWRFAHTSSRTACFHIFLFLKLRLFFSYCSNSSELRARVMSLLWCRAGYLSVLSNSVES